MNAFLGLHDLLTTDYYRFPACGVRLAAAGYGVFGMDYEGHGKSMGTRCYIRSFHRLVDDCDRFYKSICGTVPLSSSLLILQEGK